MNKRVNDIEGKVTTFFRHMQGLGDFFGVSKRNLVGMRDEIDLHGDGRGELGEIIVVGEIPIYICDLRFVIYDFKFMIGECS